MNAPLCQLNIQAYTLSSYISLKKHPSHDCGEAIMTCCKTALTPFLEGDPTVTHLVIAPSSRSLSDASSSRSGPIVVARGPTTSITMTHTWRNSKRTGNVPLVRRRMENNMKLCLVPDTQHRKREVTLTRRHCELRSQPGCSGLSSGRISFVRSFHGP